jgi:hypothetical protein
MPCVANSAENVFCTWTGTKGALAWQSNCSMFQEHGRWQLAVPQYLWKVVTSVGFGTRIGQLETKRKARSMRIDVAGLRNNSITLETSQALAVSRWE